MKNSYIILLLFICIIGCQKQSSRVIATAIPALESILNNLLENTSITVINPVPNDISFEEHNEFWKEHNTLLDSLARTVVAVVDMRNAIPNETLFLKLRKRNIKIIEIDAITPFDENISSIGLIENSDEINPYVWLSITNIMKMAEISAKDLIKLFPSDSSNIINNLKLLKKRYFALKTNYELKFSTITQFDAITMDNSFDYLLKDINFFVTSHYSSDMSTWTKENVTQFNNDIANDQAHTIIHRWKPIGDLGRICNNNNIKIAVLTTGDPKLKHFDKGLFGLVEKNLMTLNNVFQRND